MVNLATYFASSTQKQAQAKPLKTGLWSKKSRKMFEYQNSKIFLKITTGEGCFVANKTSRKKLEKKNSYKFEEKVGHKAFF